MWVLCTLYWPHETKIYNIHLASSTRGLIPSKAYCDKKWQYFGKTHSWIQVSEFLTDLQLLLILLPISMKFCMEHQDLSGMVTKQAPRGLRPQKPIKKLSHSMDLAGQLLSRNHVFYSFRLIQECYIRVFLILKLTLYV